MDSFRDYIEHMARVQGIKLFCQILSLLAMNLARVQFLLLSASRELWMSWVRAREQGRETGCKSTR